MRRGNLQLAVTARALRQYYLYTDNNAVQPAQFIGNRVAGILFENKLDHTTYFGTNIEYIQGIHMIPLLPSSPYVRRADFVSQEWDTFFSNGRAEQVVGGWKGILFGNYATINPSAAWAFFNSSNFSPDWIDGGASLTWYLAYTAGEFFSLIISDDCDACVTVPLAIYWSILTPMRLIAADTCAQLEAARNGEKIKSPSRRGFGNWFVIPYGLDMESGLWKGRVALLPCYLDVLDGGLWYNYGALIENGHFQIQTSNSQMVV